MDYQLRDHFQVQADGERTWDFFSRAENLPLITPPWLGFTITNVSQLQIQADSTLDYTLRWMGLPVKWRTKIIDWSPPRQFIDLQIRGPYTLWHHQHRFTPAEDGGTICEDRVIYRLPGPLVGRVIHALIVKKQLLEIFNFRRQVIGQHLGMRKAFQDVTISRLD